MNKEALLLTMSALQIELGLLLVFTMALRLGLQERLGRFWKVRIWMGLTIVTALTLLAFIYQAFWR